MSIRISGWWMPGIPRSLKSWGISRHRACLPGSLPMMPSFTCPRTRVVYGNSRWWIFSKNRSGLYSFFMRSVVRSSPPNTVGNRRLGLGVFLVAFPVLWHAAWRQPASSSVSFHLRIMLAVGWFLAYWVADCWQKNGYTAIK